MTPFIPNDFASITPPTTLSTVATNWLNSNYNRSFSPMGLLSTIAGPLGGLFSSGINAAMNWKMMKDQQKYNTAEREAAQAYNTSEREASQSWQDSQRKAQNQYAEDMYNMYQSPAALVQQYSNAGLNPRLAINSSSVGRVSASSGSSGGAPSGSHVNPMGYSPPYMDTKGFASSFGEIANALKSLSEAKKNGIDTKYLEDEWKEKIKSYKLSNSAQELLNSVNYKYLDKQQRAILDKFAVEIANGKLTYSALEQQIELLKKENVIKQNDVDHWLEKFSADLDATYALTDNYRASSADSYASVSLKKVQEGLVRAQEHFTNEQALTESAKRDLLSSTKKMQDLVSQTHQLELDIRNGAKIAEIRSRRMSLRKLYWESKRDLQRARYASSSEYLSDDTYSDAVKPTSFNELHSAFNNAIHYVRTVIYP